MEHALKLAKEAKEKGQPLSIAIEGNAAEVLPKLVQMGFIPDVVTDQTAAHDPLTGYIPKELTLHEAGQLRQINCRIYQTGMCFHRRSR